MRYWHFTGSEHLAGILRDGITEGGIPVPNPDGSARGLVQGWQWLTDDPSFTQGWATRQMIHCDRTEYRFAVVIPKSARAQLCRWSEVAQRFGYTGDLFAHFDALGGGGSPHWYVFHGRIPPGWLRGVEARPIAVGTAP